MIGVVNDKNIDKILKILPKKAIYYFCKAKIPRGLNAQILKEKAKNFNLDGKAYNSVTTAYQSAVNSAKKTDMIFIGGSTFIVAEVV